MTESMDPTAIYERGTANLDDLRGAERLVFMLQDFDNLMDMEGWDHFFLYARHFAWYPEMKEWLRKIDDAASIAVLDDYESHVRSLGFELTPAGVDDLLNSRGSERGFEEVPDWRERYSELRDERWNKAVAFLEAQGITLE